MSFNDRLSEFEKLNCKVLAVSVDSEFSHLAWTKVPRKEGGLGPMKLPLVADLTKNIAREYGVLLDAGIALRGLFIIDSNGKIRQQTVNDLPIGRSVDETLRLLQAIQHFDQFGEVCPANWMKGHQTVRCDVTERLFQPSKIPKSSLNSNKLYFKGIEMPKAVVIGGSGFLGGHLIEGLLAAGFSVKCFDIVAPTIKVEYCIGDLRDSEGLCKALDSVDIVFNCAAPSPHSANKY